MSGGSINYTKQIRRLAKITLSNINKKSYETTDPVSQEMWASFAQALDDTKNLPEGSVRRGLLAYSDGSKLESADLIDLAAGNIFKIIFFEIFLKFNIFFYNFNSKRRHAQRPRRIKSRGIKIGP